MPDKLTIRNAVARTGDVYVGAVNNGDDTFRLSIPGRPEIGYDVPSWADVPAGCDDLAARVTPIAKAEEAVQAAVDTAIAAVTAKQDVFAATVTPSPMPVTVSPAVA